MSGCLMVIATPIGHLEDITLRALRSLKEVDLIACENTRKTLKLLNHYQIKKPLICYSEHQWYHHPSQNKTRRIKFLINQLKKGKKIGLVSNAGTPLISDPGYNLVKVCIEENIPVVPIPGVTAATAALSVAGVPGNRFIFEGFLPLKPTKRHKILQDLKNASCPIIIYEAPHRLLKTLNELYKVLGDCSIVIARELTKYYEEIRRGKITEMIDYFSQHRPQGEFTLILASVNTPDLK